MKIAKSKDLEIFVFNVERGLSVLIKTPQDYCIIYDLGSTSDFSPINWLVENRLFDSFMEYSEPNLTKKRIAQCIISHPHLDHISDLNSAVAEFISENAFYITCQNDKEENTRGHSIDFLRINNPCNASDEIERYKSLYIKRKLPLSTLIQYDEDALVDFKIGYYYLAHKQADELFDSSDQDYTNALSIVLHLSYGKHSILLTGDVTPEAFEQIYNGKCERRFTDYSIKQGAQKKESWSRTTSDQPTIKSLVRNGLTVLQAPHHGLESGYPSFLFESLGESNRPKMILISDKRHIAENAGSTHPNYQNGVASSGILHNGETRYSVSTANDGHIKISLSGSNIATASGKNIEDLFA